MKSIILTVLAIFLLQYFSYSSGRGPQRTMDIRHTQSNNDEQNVFPRVGSYFDEAGLDSFIIATMASHYIPGLAACIVRNDQIIWKCTHGFANIDEQREVSDSTLFLIASTSKTVTTTAIMQLWEEGLFDMDDDINDYLPDELQVINPNFQNEIITFRMLLTHTSSIHDNLNVTLPLEVPGDSPVALDSFLVNYLMPGGVYFADLSYIKNWGPGERYAYCNVGFALIAYLVEKISGKSFDTYCADNIFTPLGMDRSSWFLAGMDTTNIAMPYVWNDVDYTPCKNRHYGFPDYPSGSLRTSIIELYKFLSAYIQGGKFADIRILDSTTVQLINSVQLPDLIPGFVFDKYQGLGWYKIKVGESWVWGHDGSYIGTTISMYFIPERKEGYIILCNGDGMYDPTYMGMVNILKEIDNFIYVYDKIYATKTKLDKLYLHPETDTLLVNTKFVNRADHNFTSNLIYTSIDSSIVDSIPLDDDGNHNDSQANDGIWGNKIELLSEENEFIVSVSSTDLTNGEYFKTKESARFTTIGPIVYDSHKFTTGTLADKINLSLRNEGLSTTAKNIMAELTSPDTAFISNISTSEVVTDISPKQTVELEQDYFLSTKGIPDSIRFNIKIYSSGYHYWSDNFTLIVSSIERSEDRIPKVFALQQNYPNPFNPKTIINYELPITNYVDISIYNLLGQKVITLVNGKQKAGFHSVEWDASGLASGVYYYRLQAEGFVDTKKLVLLR